MYEEMKLQKNFFIWGRWSNHENISGVIFIIQKQQTDKKKGYKNKRNISKYLDTLCYQAKQGKKFWFVEELQGQTHVANNNVQPWPRWKYFLPMKGSNFGAVRSYHFIEKRALTLQWLTAQNFNLVCQW